MSKEPAKKEFKVTHEGSLGVLALGSVGLKLWRKAVEEHKIEKAKKLKAGNGKGKK
jgi:hypothetical protein